MISTRTRAKYGPSKISEFEQRNRKAARNLLPTDKLQRRYGGYMELMAIGPTASLSFLMVTFLAVAPYAAGIGLIALKLFPFPQLGWMVIALQTCALFYAVVIRNVRKFITNLPTKEERYIKKLSKQWKKEYKIWDHYHYFENGYDGYLSENNRRLFYEPGIKKGARNCASRPFERRETAGRFTSDKPIIAPYRVQIRFAHRPDEYCVYYTDGYGPEDAERCFKQFLEDTKDIIITDCNTDCDVTVMNDMDHEVYIDFFSGKTFDCVKCYVAEGTVDYDYGYTEKNA